MANNENTKKVVVPRQSVHVVFFSCPDCGEEAEHIHFCEDCGKPMRVINVVEKFGDEAEEFLARFTKQTENGNGKKNIPVSSTTDDNDDEQPNVIMLAQDEDTLNDGALIVDDDIDSLGEIYPDDDEDEEKTASSAKEGFDDLEDIIAELDKEEDDEFPLAEELGDEGLPEL